MKNIILLSFLFLSVTCAYSQNLIGYNEQEIKTYMKDNNKDMNFNNVTNSKFKYLKYSDNSESQTLLFFLNEESVCQSVRLICDLSYVPAKLKEFNDIYKNNGENTWVDSRNGKDYSVILKKEKWSCIVSIDPTK